MNINSMITSPLAEIPKRAISLISLPKIGHRGHGSQSQNLNLNKRYVAILLLFVLLTGCVARKSTTPISSVMPENFYDLPKKDIQITYRKPSTIDLRETKKDLVWIYTPDLTDCFGLADNPGYLSIDSGDKLLSAKLVVNYLPTIWSDEEDNVVQLIDFPSLCCLGSKEVKIDYGCVLILKDEDLFMIPDNVKNHVTSITQQDLLSVLDAEGKEHELENWSAENKIWRSYINEYRPGDFIKTSLGNNRFGTYPNTFYLQLTFEGKKGRYVKNLCDKVIIGN